MRTHAMAALINETRTVSHSYGALSVFFSLYRISNVRITICEETCVKLRLKIVRSMESGRNSAGSVLNNKFYAMNDSGSPQMTSA